MIDLAPVRAFARGGRYEEESLLKCCRDLTDTVYKSHFKAYAWDEELYSVAMFGILKVIRERRVDLSKPATAFFSFFYTTVRNFIGNHLKSEFRRNQDSGPSGQRGSQWDVRRDPRCPESAAIVRASVTHEARVVFDRLKECGVREQKYARDIASAAVYRALAFAG